MFISIFAYPVYTYLFYSNPIKNFLEANMEIIEIESSSHIFARDSIYQVILPATFQFQFQFFYISFFLFKHLLAGIKQWRKFNDCSTLN